MKLALHKDGGHFFLKKLGQRPIFCNLFQWSLTYILLILRNNVFLIPYGLHTIIAKFSKIKLALHQNVEHFGRELVESRFFGFLKFYCKSSCINFSYATHTTHSLFWLHTSKNLVAVMK